MSTSSSNAARSATNCESPYQVLQETENSGLSRIEKSTALLARSILFTETYRKKRDTIWMDAVDSEGNIRKAIPIFTYIKAIPSKSIRSLAVSEAMQVKFKDFSSFSELLEHRESLGLDEFTCIQIAMKRARQVGFYNLTDLHDFTEFMLKIFQGKKEISEKLNAEEYIQLFLSVYNLLQANLPENRISRLGESSYYYKADLHRWHDVELPSILLNHLDSSSREVLLSEMRKNIAVNPDSTKGLALNLLKQITGTLQDDSYFMPLRLPLQHILLGKELCLLLKKDRDISQYLTKIAFAYIQHNEFATAEALIQQALAFKDEGTPDSKIKKYKDLSWDALFYLPFLPHSRFKEDQIRSYIKSSWVSTKTYAILLLEKSDERDELLIKEILPTNPFSSNYDVLFLNPQRRKEWEQEARKKLEQLEAANASASATTSSSAAANSN